MKNNQQLSSNSNIGNRMSPSTHHFKVPKHKPSKGSLAGKYPVILDDGKTIIYISDKSMESEARKSYEMRKNNKFMGFAKKQLL